MRIVVLLVLCLSFTFAVNAQKKYKDKGGMYNSKKNKCEHRYVRTCFLKLDKVDYVECVSCGFIMPDTEFTIENEKK